MVITREASKPGPVPDSSMAPRARIVTPASSITVMVTSVITSARRRRELPRTLPK